MLRPERRVACLEELHRPQVARARVRARAPARGAGRGWQGTEARPRGVRQKERRVAWHRGRTHASGRGPTPLFVKQLARTEARLSGLLAVTDGNTGLSDLRRGGIGLALRRILSPYAAVIGIEDAVSPVGGRAYLLGRFRPLLLVDGLRVALLPLLFFSFVCAPSCSPSVGTAFRIRQTKKKPVSDFTSRAGCLCVTNEV